MSLQTNISLNNAIIPSTPFLWYREEQLLCPIIHITAKSGIPIIVQTHILENANIYICLHSLMYYMIHNKNESNLLVIPQEYVKQLNFSVTITEIEGELLDIPNNGLKLNTTISGPVIIHGGAFSPPGCLFFKVNLDNKLNKILCNIVCPELNININCLFILFNDLSGDNIDENIKKFISENL